MEERAAIDQRMRDHFEALWRQGDPWQLETSELDQNRYLRQAALLGDRRYRRALDAGCGSGDFTRRLAEMADEVLAFDIAPSAVERAKARCGDMPNIVFRVQNIMEFKPRAEGPFDLVVMSEAITSLGWLYPLFDIGWQMAEFYAALAPEGRFLLVDTKGRETDYLLLPWLVATYRDLFRNIGYALEREEVLTGTKNGVRFEILLSLFKK